MALKANSPRVAANGATVLLVQCPAPPIDSAVGKAKMFAIPCAEDLTCDTSRLWLSPRRSPPCQWRAGRFQRGAAQAAAAAVSAAAVSAAAVSAAAVSAAAVSAALATARPALDRLPPRPPTTERAGHLRPSK